MWMNSCVFLLLIVFLSPEHSLNASKSIKDWKIVKGQPSYEGDYPSVVSLAEILFLGHICGGTLINSNTILTAAHCFQKYFIIEVKWTIVALIGRIWTNKYKTSSVRHSIKKYIPHEKYVQPKANEPTNYDIAIIVLKTHVPESNFVKYGKLSERNSRLPPNTEVTIVGFGQVNSTTSSNVIRSGTMKVISKQWCFRLSGPILAVKVDQSFFCVIPSPSTGCSGDSGGPVFYERVIQENSGLRRVEQVQYGVQSAFMGSKFCEDSSGSILTEVSDYLDWIKENSGASRIGIWAGHQHLKAMGFIFLIVLEIFQI